MNSFWLGRQETPGSRTLRRSRAAFGVTAVAATALLAAACSSGAPVPAPAARRPPHANLSALAKDVNQGAAQPSFSTYAARYGSK